MRRTIHPRDPEWPLLLNELGPHRAPERLFACGLRLDHEKTHVAIVGTRRPTIAGIEAAQLISRALAQAGFVIVSGLALGIDSVAHRSALEVGGSTVAVLGCGLDIAYPTRNKRLQEQIAHDGTLLSEYVDGTRPATWTFPERNRIVAGLSKAVVVIEGGAKSGALITARIALDANRSVFAVPGSMRNAMACGPNELIRTSQAALVTDPNHIFQELAPDLVWRDPVSTSLSAQPTVLDESEGRVLSLLDDAPTSVERICTMARLNAGQVALALSRLEVRGLVKRRPAGYEISNAGARLRRIVNRDD